MVAAVVVAAVVEAAVVGAVAAGNRQRLRRWREEAAAEACPRPSHRWAEVARGVVAA